MKFAVIGLGRFGYQVATVLSDNGMEVLAVDSNESIVTSIKDKVTQALCVRITDEDSLQSISIEDMDVVIVAMGENVEQSILITALLKKRLNIQKVIARGINDIHKEILELIGADRVILPEKEIGSRLADVLSSPFTELTRLSPYFSISQIAAPKQFIGKTITELNLLENYTLRFVGVRHPDDTIESVPDSYIIQEHDKILLAGNNNNLEWIAKM
ncbi:MAG: TrkA family potassium uptake protein [Candidatus Babeliales bacterium]